MDLRNNLAVHMNFYDFSNVSIKFSMSNFGLNRIKSKPNV